MKTLSHFLGPAGAYAGGIAGGVTMDGIITGNFITLLMALQLLEFSN